MGKIVYYISKGIIRKITSKTKTKFDDILIDIIEEPLIFLIITIGFFLGYTQLNLADNIANIFTGLTRMFTTLAFAWFFLRFIDSLIVHYLIPATKKTESDLDDHLIPIIRKLSKIIIISITFIMILSNFGYDVTSIVAGLGIGGLAVAFAAKDMLANLFGGFTIVIDKPFKMGQWIEVGGYTGEVVEIGLRSTRLKTSNGEYITIPNSFVAEKGTVNYKKYRQRLVTFTLGLACDTSNAKMKKSKEIVKKVISKQALLKEDSVEVNFVNFGDFTYDLEVRYIINTNSAGEVRKVKDAVNTEIKELLEKNKIELSYPTQTLYLKKL
ncbi:mechanosensitive ion channel family protein [Candidatus Woesearchaeota archaeon]|nr:mechanosensitive ion channel family protein [Candidatus Woesearchaeota archaeon]